MPTPNIYAVDIIRHRQIVKREKNLAEGHSVTRLCVDSRWPYTATLSQQQIACMRDTYCGRRVKPTALEARPTYDRIHMPEEGWDQRVKMGSRHFLKPIQFSARDEERHRKVVVGANATYGHRWETFYDFQSKENRTVRSTQHFQSRNGTGLPSLFKRK